MKKTPAKKEMILNAALELFNEYGFGAVTLQRVGEELHMSKGNVAYHFANTEVMLQAIHAQMYAEMEGVILPMQDLGLGQLQQMFLFFRQFQRRYRFFFEDLALIARRFPELAMRHQQIVGKRQEEGKALLTYFIGKGLLLPEPTSGYYAALVDTIWHTMTFWAAREAVWQYQLSDSEPFQQVWLLLQPSLTEAGQAEFQQLNLTPSEQ